MSLAGRGIVDDQTRLLRARGGLFGSRYFRSGATYQAKPAVGGKPSVWLSVSCVEIGCYYRGFLW